MIRVVGIGPSRDDMTIRALNAIDEADVIIGYKGYIKHIDDLVKGKKVVSKGMGQELLRAELAVRESKAGKNVVLISSGDPGVFGMANVLFQLMGKYKHLEVEVIPGISAVNFAASILGAPLHDFAVISLSDLLTPLSEIKCKIKKACEGDFVIAFYNPMSKTRKKPFAEALNILQDEMKPSTPVGLVKGKDGGADVKITSLENLPSEEIDMSTIIIVGNSMSYVEDGRMVTPRGYMVPYSLHPLAIEFYEKYLDGEGADGPNLGCEYYPCHHHPQNCTFCYCPFYPCADPSTGGRWIKEKGVWSCEGCTWIHEDKTVQCIQAKLPSIVENIGDLKKKKKELLKLRRECIRNTEC
ncbi:MAG TPA: precorrin-3B C(17)-methyltransferase [Methanobacterium sp.]|jgi:precorrin-3B C17-methyltransferase|nr:MAG: precorrin-3B C(17)-methyltransferase [Methanobacterium sp.]HOI71984.1 precorrin-3B C(17)-methyltransferase [Methanobacterium sp.]